MRKAPDSAHKAGATLQIDGPPRGNVFRIEPGPKKQEILEELLLWKDYWGRKSQKIDETKRSSDEYAMFRLAGRMIDDVIAQVGGMTDDEAPRRVRIATATVPTPPKTSSRPKFDAILVYSDDPAKSAPNEPLTVGEVVTHPRQLLPIPATQPGAPSKRRAAATTRGAGNAVLAYSVVESGPAGIELTALDVAPYRKMKFGTSGARFRTADGTEPGEDDMELFLKPDDIASFAEHGAPGVLKDEAFKWLREHPRK
ncbi:MAG TPA: hypothetical protein VEU29_07335 [Actinomycetota bacterium]|nr:hypothetical protein [Actinomycetota bacterium]